MFTRSFGKVRYKISQSESLILPDMTRYAGIPREYKRAPFALDYTIKEGERIDQISNKIYGTPERWFLIALYNDMTDLVNDWPMTQDELKAHMLKKYGTANPMQIVHWVNDDGLIEDPVGVGAFLGCSADEAVARRGLKAVTAFDHEHKLNDVKKKIKILDPDRVGSVEEAIRKEFWLNG